MFNYGNDYGNNDCIMTGITKVYGNVIVEHVDGCSDHPGISVINLTRLTQQLATTISTLHCVRSRPFKSLEERPTTETPQSFIISKGSSPGGGLALFTWSYYRMLSLNKLRSGSGAWGLLYFILLYYIRRIYCFMMIMRGLNRPCCCFLLGNCLISMFHISSAVAERLSLSSADIRWSVVMAERQRVIKLWFFLSDITGVEEIKFWFHLKWFLTNKQKMSHFRKKILDLVALPTLCKNKILQNI